MSVYMTRSNGVTQDDIARLQGTYGLCGGDLQQIKQVGEMLKGQIEGVVEQFYVWLEQQPVWEVFLAIAIKWKN
jgi:hypothetical protein